MKKKRIIFIVLIVALLGGAWFGYGEYSRKVRNLRNVNAQLHLQPQEIINAFEKNEIAANAKYLDKIIAVKGSVKSIETNDLGHYTIVLGEAASLSSVRCSMDSLYVKELTGIKEDAVITVKGFCTGFSHDELLGSDVILNRCVLENEN
jgi:tRNA_anti-like